MMSLATLIYLASLSNNVAIFFGVVSGITAFVFFIICMICVFKLDMMYGKEREPAIRDVKLLLKKSSKIIVPLFLLSMFIALALPRSTTVYLMIGANAAQDLYKSEEGAKIMTLINDKLDEEIKKEVKK